LIDQMDVASLERSSSESTDQRRIAMRLRYFNREGIEIHPVLVINTEYRVRGWHWVDTFNGDYGIMDDYGDFIPDSVLLP